MEIRQYDPSRDREAVQRIWREVGWLEDEKGHREGLGHFTECGKAFVADIRGSAECLVLTAPGSVRYLDEDLPMSCVTAVTTGRIARKQGFAGKMTAHAVAVDAAEGAAVSSLGMFEQGYYNRLGFGTGVSEHMIAFDPGSLCVGKKANVPVRLGREDWERMHASRRARLRGHGSCSIDAAAFTRAAALWTKNGFGLGYIDESSGELTHHFWCWSGEGEWGPLRVEWMAYRTWDQFLELMALLQGLGDQIKLVRMLEPQGIQVQDLISMPFHQNKTTRKGEMETGNRAIAFWQMRICDLHKCLEKTRLRGGEARFNLRLEDPVTRYLDGGSPWGGIGGEYVVTLGESSGAEEGREETLPTLETTVGAFTRLWLGVKPATGLAVTDDLRGDAALLDQLDSLLRLPEPHPDWPF